MQSLFIRADANTKIGVGHVMRCLALAEAWVERGGKVTFLLNNPTALIAKLLSEIPARVIHIRFAYPDLRDIHQTLQEIKEQPNAWLVLDGYHFDEAYQNALYQVGRNLLALDDGMLLDRHWPVDILLNQNLGAEVLQYNGVPTTQYLLGSSYVLLRKAFRNTTARKKQSVNVVQRILVTLGGGDPDNQTLKVLNALQLLKTPHLDVCVVVGATNPHFETLSTVSAQSSFNIELVSHTNDMPGLMAWADVAISAGGSTCWELAFMGVPNAIIVTADNQIQIAQALGLSGISENLGWFETVSSEDIAQVLLGLFENTEKRMRMFEAGQTIVDGLGAFRVVEAMHRIAG